MEEDDNFEDEEGTLEPDEDIKQGIRLYISLTLFY